MMLARGAGVEQLARGWIDLIFTPAKARLDELHRFARLRWRLNAVNRYLDGFSRYLDGILRAQLPLAIVALHQFVPQQLRHLVSMFFVHRAEGPRMSFVTLPAARVELARLLFGWKMRRAVSVFA